MAVKPGPAFGGLTAEEAQRLEEATRFLQRFVPQAWAYFHECQQNPTPGSFIARASRHRDLVNVLNVSLLLDAAGDHLTTIVNQVERGLLPRFSLYTVVLGALEADAWVCWLLD